MRSKRRRQAEWIVDRIQATPEPAADGELSPVERAALEREAKDLDAVWSALATLDTATQADLPSAAMTRRFERHLAGAVEGPQTAPPRGRFAPTSRRTRHLWFGLAASAAAAIALFVTLTPWRVGDRPRPSVAVGPSDAPTTMARLEAVAAGPRSGEPASASCGPLLGTLREDPSPVVRFSALETFRERCGGHLPPGGLSLILEHESDLLVRLTLIRAIGQYRVAADAGTLRQLERDPQVDPIARAEIERALKALAS